MDHKIAFARSYSLGEPIIIGWFGGPGWNGIRIMQYWLYDEMNHGPVGPPETECEYSTPVPLPDNFYSTMPKTPEKWKDKTKIKFDTGHEFPLAQFVNELTGQGGIRRTMTQFFPVTEDELRAIFKECCDGGFMDFDDESFDK